MKHHYIYLAVQFKIKSKTTQNQMQVRMQSEKKLHLFLVGMQNHAATLEDISAVFCKAKYTLAK